MRDLIESIKADREAGSPGQWEGRHCPFGGLPVEPCEYGVISLDTGKEAARIWSLADARRIERLPALEEAFLHQVQEIERLRENEKFLRDCLADRGMSATKKLSN